MQGCVAMPFKSEFIEETVQLDFYQTWKTLNSQFFQTSPLFLCSFPRSGNGWVRLVLAAILLQANGVDLNTIELVKKTTSKNVGYICFRSGEFEYDIEDIFPDIYLMDHQREEVKCAKDFQGLNLPAKLIKTHHIVDCKLSKVIFLFREPLSCLTSAALLLNSVEIEKNPYQINQTIIYLAKYYNQMLEFYLRQKQQYPERCFLLSHAKVANENTAFEFDKVVKFMKISVNHELVKKGVEKFPFKSGYQKKYIESISDYTQDLVHDLVEPNYQKVLALSC